MTGAESSCLEFLKAFVSLYLHSICCLYKHLQKYNQRCVGGVTMNVFNVILVATDNSCGSGGGSVLVVVNVVVVVVAVVVLALLLLLS